MRYFIEFSYFGKAYHGWQRQPNAISVQQVLEEALSTLLRTTISMVGAGRTDTGVHARQMFAHFDTDTIADTGDLVHRLNSFLPSDISIRSIFEVKPDAHARFDALQRSYAYWVVQEKNPFYQDTAHYVHLPLDLKSMNESASFLLEHDDFECFSKSNTDVKTFICNVKEAVWVQENEKLVFKITADRFLRNMVRAIVGTLLDVGLGKIEVGQMHDILASKKRSEAGVSVPAKGLYLTEVLYPETIYK